MADEFQELQESDVIFAGNNAGDDDLGVKCSGNDDSGESRRVKRKKIQKKETSLNIPVTFAGKSWLRCIEPSLFEYEDDGELVPPHVMVGRRVAGKMAFSVCSGIGRTLKGRDLSEMRNSVLKMTGFLET